MRHEKVVEVLHCTPFCLRRRALWIFNSESY